MITWPWSNRHGTFIEPERGDELHFFNEKGEPVEVKRISATKNALRRALDGLDDGGDAISRRLKGK